MQFYDYHTHSKYSPDAVDSIEDMCAAAEEKGICEIAITDHVECNGFDNGQAVFDARLYRPLEIQEEIALQQKRFAGRLKILNGVELGQPLEGLNYAERLIEENDYDFIIASCHSISGKDDFYYLDYGKINVDRLMNDYLDELIKYADWGKFDVLGHLTYPLRYMSASERKIFALERYYDKLTELFSRLVQKGLGIEMNTSGFRTVKEPMPGLKVLKLYREAGGEVITMGSDAHRRDYLAYRFGEGLEVLRAAGFKYISTFEKRRIKFVSI